MTYDDLLAAIPRPTDDQISGFAANVAHAHSWYKKLSMLGEGEPFFLYLHPYPHAMTIERMDGSSVWRDVVREPIEGSIISNWRVDLQDGDVHPGRTGPLAYLFGNLTTAEHQERLGHWSYWNWGHAGQTRVEALEQAAAGLRVALPGGEQVAIPEVGLELGLVYLRATVYGDMGPRTSQYEKLRAEHGLPTVEEDQAAQFDEMRDAMRRVVTWAYGA